MESVSNAQRKIFSSDSISMMASIDHAKVDHSLMLEGGLGADTNRSTFSEAEGL